MSGWGILSVPPNIPFFYGTKTMTDINWRDHFDEAIEEAKDTDTFLFLDFAKDG